MTPNDKDDDGTEAGTFAPFQTTEFPPPSATVQVEIGAYSERGRSRPTNDDHYLVVRLTRDQETLRTSLPDAVVAERFAEYGFGVVVADGLGDPGVGGATSQLALATLLYLLRAFGQWNLRIDGQIAQQILARAERFYRQVDATVVHQRRSGPVELEQTTLTAAFSAGRDLFFAHVGHSRAYLLRQGHLLRLTRDHTIGRNGTSTVSVAPLVSVNDAARDLKHILTNTIGLRGAAGPFIDLERFRLDDNDRILVCTNGLTDVIDEKIIGEILDSKQSADDQCHALVDLALSAGGEDDTTAVVARYRVPQKTT